MALNDDLSRLAAQDVVYLTRCILSDSLKEVFRGRLRQALNGNWVYNASTGQNGAVGFDLGPTGGSWSSSESPSTGIQISISYPAGQVPATGETILLTTVIPSDFAD